jgi:serine/threonine protein kinase
MVGFSRLLVRHGRYTIVRKIAEGGMAEIFLAQQHGPEGFQKVVILKRILTAFYADEQFRNMLIDEAHISMGLSHNNIVQILDVGKAGGRFFLVMELVDGWDLGRLVPRSVAAGTPLPAGLGLYILSEVCRALSYAHAKTDPQGRALGIVHRDVSPHNILISDQGEVKLTDFGVAKAMTKRDSTGVGIVKGKIAFMSPEQALGQAIDARADLYAVGILLYLLATGRRPFDAPTDMEVLLRVQSGQYPPPEKVNPRLSASLSFVITKAMTADRNQRYQSADELLVDLEAILRAEYDSVGQTALKLWLAALARRDNGVPISRAAAQAGGEAVEGKSVQLGDDEDDGRDRDEEEDLHLEAMGGHIHDGTLAGPPTRRPTARSAHITGSEATSLSDLALPLPEVGLRWSASRGHASSSDMALPVADDEPFTRMRPRRSRGRSTFRAIVMLAALGGAAAGIWQVLKSPAADDRRSAAGLPPAAPDAAAVALPVTVPGRERRLARESAPAPAVVPHEAAPLMPAPVPSNEATPPAGSRVPPPSAVARPHPTPHSGPGATRKPGRNRPNPYARARSWQKPEEPLAPGISPSPPPAEPPAPPAPAPEQKPSAESPAPPP